MAKELDTGMILFGLAVLLGMGFIFYKISTPTAPIGVTSLPTQTKLTEFVRDSEGRISQILEYT